MSKEALKCPVTGCDKTFLPRGQYVHWRNDHAHDMDYGAFKDLVASQSSTASTGETLDALTCPGHAEQRGFLYREVL